MGISSAEYGENVKVIITMKYILTFLLCISTAHALDNDKILHVEASTIIAYAGTEIYKDSMHLVLYPFVTAIAFGIAKEASDSRFDHNDLSADAVAAVIGTTLGSQKYVLPSWYSVDKYLLQSYLSMSAIDVWRTRKCLTNANCVEGNAVTYNSYPSANRLAATHAAGGYVIYELADIYPQTRTSLLICVNVIQFLAVRKNYFTIQF